MGFEAIIILCYAVGSICGVLGLMPRWRGLHRPAAWAIATGFAAHTLMIAMAFVSNGLDTFSRGQLIQVMAWSLVFVYCISWWRLRFSILGMTAGPLALILFLFSSALGNVEGGLPEAMTGTFFMLHLGVLSVNFALISLGLGSALSFLSLHRKLKSKKFPLETTPHTPALATVGRINGLVILLGFPLFTIGLVTGFVWAHIVRDAAVTADPKEIASILVWLLYALIFVQRFVLGWQGKKVAVMLVVLFVATLFSLAGNLFMDSHHNFFQTPIF